MPDFVCHATCHNNYLILFQTSWANTTKAFPTKLCPTHPTTIIVLLQTTQTYMWITLVTTGSQFGRKFPDLAPNWYPNQSLPIQIRESSPNVDLKITCYPFHHPRLSCFSAACSHWRPVGFGRNISFLTISIIMTVIVCTAFMPTLMCADKVQNTQFWCCYSWQWWASLQHSAKKLCFLIAPLGLLLS